MEHFYHWITFSFTIPLHFELFIRNEMQTALTEKITEEGDRERSEEETAKQSFNVGQVVCE